MRTGDAELVASGPDLGGNDRRGSACVAADPGVGWGHAPGPGAAAKGRPMLRRLLDMLFARTKAPKSVAPSGDYAGDRETDRLGHMSAEDRAWETESRRRSDERTGNGASS